MKWLRGLLVFLRHYQLQSIVLTVVVTVLGALLARGIYNYYFHPLRDFPGPVCASVSDFWKLYICWTKESHTIGIELHKLYGYFLLRDNPPNSPLANVGTPAIRTRRTRGAKPPGI